MYCHQLQHLLKGIYEVINLNLCYVVVYIKKINKIKKKNFELGEFGWKQIF